MNSNGKRPALDLPPCGMPGLAASCGSTAADLDQVELDAMVNSDVLIANWLQKAGKAPSSGAEDPRLVIPPRLNFVGVDPPANTGNPYRQVFFTKDFCYITKNFRIRRSVFFPNGVEENRMHFVYLLKTTGKDQFNITKFSLQDVQALHECFASILADVNAYEK